VQEVSSPAPCIIGTRAPWSLYFDSEKLVEKPMATFGEAFKAWFTVFFVFMVCYPEAVKHTCLFLEKYVICHKVTAPGTVDRLAAKLQLKLVSSSRM
jgi:hypothetical protein